MDAQRTPTAQPLLSVTPTTTLTAADKQAIVAMCTRAFEEDFGDLFDMVTASMHIMAFLDGNLVSHACWALRQLQPAGHPPLRTAYVDAVATDPAFQGRGLGSQVIQRLNAEIQDYALGGLSTSRVAFYARLGWELWRGPTAVQSADGPVATPDDTVMILRTPHTPPLDTTVLLTAVPRGGHPW